jgi:methylase of polypeptide subunit release factors
MIVSVGTTTVADAAAQLGVALREVGYSEDALDLLGEEATTVVPEDVPVLRRRLPPRRLGTVLELLFLACPVSRRDAVQALGRRGVDALELTGLAEVGGEMRPRARVVPVRDLLIAGDSFSRGSDDPPDYVAPFSPTSELLAALTPRRRVRSALDVGSGSGAQALLAARHARWVVATDVNDHALELTRLNASLNGFTNIECRRGSLFEPVGDERFDLITCNAPYVVSPERRWMYRDSGHTGDEMSALVVEGAGARLADGGFATLNVSWLARDEDEPDERVLQWIDTDNCDAWVVVAWEADRLDHASDWMPDAPDDPQAIDDALDEWTRYFDELDAQWVNEGTVMLHRRGGKGHDVRIDSIDPDILDDAAEQVERAFVARERLSRLSRQDELLGARLSIAATLRFEHELDPRRKRSTAVVALAEGTNSAVETTPDALDVVRALDGTVTLEAAVQAVARRNGTSDALRRDALRLTRDLLELGALTIDER